MSSITNIFQLHASSILFGASLRVPSSLLFFERRWILSFLITPALLSVKFLRGCFRTTDLLKLPLFV
jgi:hypothetical protein